MIEEIPIYVTAIFGLTVIATIIWFYAACKSKIFLSVVVGWTVIQSVLGLSGIYQYTEALPPRIVLFGILPVLAIIIAMFFFERGKAFMDGVNLKVLTYFHTIRIPVEIVLTLLYYSGFVSVYMTFEGTNFDLFSGITAPIVGFAAFQKKHENKKLLVGWNILCLLLLINVVVTAAFALPSPIQQLAFDQPNVAVLYFPFNLLPAVVVPLVFFGHLIALRQLVAKKKPSITDFTIPALPKNTPALP